MIILIIYSCSQRYITGEPPIVGHINSLHISLNLGLRESWDSGAWILCSEFRRLHIATDKTLYSRLVSSPGSSENMCPSSGKHAHLQKLAHKHE